MNKKELEEIKKFLKSTKTPNTSGARLGKRPRTSPSRYVRK